MSTRQSNHGHRQRRRPGHRAGRPAASAGFSLVELLVAAMLMMISTIGGTWLFNSATGQANAIRLALQQQFAISNDLATVLEINDRYSCASGTCTAVLEGNPPNQDGYVPVNVNGTVDPAFTALCTAGLSNALVSQINSTASAALISQGISRTASLEPNGTSSSPPHRYRVRWTADDGGRTLRQVQLTPTVAGWCP